MAKKSRVHVWTPWIVVTPLLLMLLLFARDAQSQESPTKARQEPVPTLATLRVAMQDPKTVDYTAWRTGTLAASGGQMYRVQLVERALAQEASQLWRAGKAVEAVDKLLEVLDINPVSISAHQSLGQMFRIVSEAAHEDSQKAELIGMAERHAAFADGLVRSILDSGDGKAADSAYRVISIGEEYVVVSHLGYAPFAQRILEARGKHYDVMETQNRAGERRTFYFDISSFAGRLP